jgi:hypothetical protein
MFRNHEGASALTLGLAVLAVALGYAGYASTTGLRLSAVMKLSIGTFVLALFVGLLTLVGSVSEQDRPSISAKLTQTAGGLWQLEGTATATGMTNHGTLQISIFAYQRAKLSEPAKKLFFVRAGANADGIASHSFTVPLPSHKRFISYAISASLGTLPVPCHGTVLKNNTDPQSIQTAPATPSPTVPSTPTTPGGGSTTPGESPTPETTSADDMITACVVVAAAPRPSPSVTSATTSVTPSPSATSLP